MAQYFYQQQVTDMGNHMEVTEMEEVARTGRVVLQVMARIIAISTVIICIHIKAELYITLKQSDL